MRSRKEPFSGKLAVSGYVRTKLHTLIVTQDLEFFLDWARLIHGPNANARGFVSDKFLAGSNQLSATAIRDGCNFCRVSLQEPLVLALFIPKDAQT